MSNLDEIIPSILSIHVNARFALLALADELLDAQAFEDFGYIDVAVRVDCQAAQGC